MDFGPTRLRSPEARSGLVGVWEEVRPEAEDDPQQMFGLKPPVILAKQHPIFRLKP